MKADNQSGMELKGDNLPSVSVIVPVYNEEGNIARCLESIQRLNYSKEKLEIIVVDDGSRDNSAAIAGQFGVRVLMQKHQGAAEARNRGAREAEGKFIAFVDADDTVGEDWLERSIPYLSQERVVAVGCSHRLLNSRQNSFMTISYYERYLRLLLSPDRTDHIGVSGSIFKKDLFLAIGGFNPGFSAAEDAELCLRIRQRGYEIILIKDMLLEVNYPKSTVGHFLTQVRNSSFLVYLVLRSLRRISGNKYSGLGDYLQSPLPSLLVLAGFLVGRLWAVPILLLIFLLVLSVMNVRFLQFLRQHRDNLGSSWIVSALSYLVVRSLAWNIGLFGGIFLAVKKQLHL